MTVGLNKPRVLMFAPCCYPPTNGAENIVTSKLLLHLLNVGWCIDVVSKDFENDFYPNDDNIFSEIRDYIFPIKTKKIGRLYRSFLKFKCFSHFQPYPMNEDIYWMLEALHRGRTLVKKKNYDLIISRSTPGYSHWPALILSREHALPWIASWSDPAPIELAPPPYGRGLNAFIPRKVINYYKKVYRSASWNVFPSDRLRNYVCRWVGSFLYEKSSIIPHIAFESLIHENKENKSFIMTHAGELRGFRKPDIFLSGLKLFLNKYKPKKQIKVNLIGQLNDEYLMKIIDKLDLQQIVIIRKASNYTNTLRLISSSSVALIIEAYSDEGIFFPSKFVDYVQESCPVLALSPKNGVISDILNRYGGGLIADGSSTEDVCEKINILYQHWISGDIDKYYFHNSIKIFNQYIIEEKYYEILENLKFKYRYKF